MLSLMSYLLVVRFSPFSGVLNLLILQLLCHCDDAKEEVSVKTVNYLLV